LMNISFQASCGNEDMIFLNFYFVPVWYLTALEVYNQKAK